MLGTVAGAESGTPVVRNFGNYRDPTKIDKIREDDPVNHKTTLYARTARHLMAHIWTTLRDDEKDLFTEQVLSESTKREYRSRGKDPGEAFDTLKEHLEDIHTLFDLMPYGEFTPNVYDKSIGGGVRRVYVAGVATQGLYWSGFDMVMEHGNWKLCWFVQPGD